MKKYMYGTISSSIVVYLLFIQSTFADLLKDSNKEIN
jgi:hypothetical protein